MVQASTIGKMMYFPPCPLFDMAIQEREADLVIGTFGRSLWIVDDIRPLRMMARNQGKNLSKKFLVFEAPVAYQANYRQAPGYDWSTYGLWNADNRRRGAMISYFIAGPKDTASRMDSLRVRIYNEKNELVRNLRWKADTGFNRQWWALEERGFRQPGSARAGRFGGGGGGAEPAGMQVLPGTYKIVLSYGQDTDSTTVVVNDDPRLIKTAEVKTAQRKMLERLRKSSDKLLTGLDRLTESDELLSNMLIQLRGLEGKEIDSLKKSNEGHAGLNKKYS